MADLKICPIAGWTNRGEPPEYYEENGLIEVYCPACFLHTGFYPTKEQADTRWNNLAAETIHIDTYNNDWTWEQKFPDHIAGNVKVLK